MGLTNGASSDEVVTKSMELKTNDLRVILTKDVIHKYVVKVHPITTTAKEKRILAKEFIARLKLDRKSSTSVQTGNFGFLFPEPQPELERTFFYAIRVRQKESFEGAARVGQFYTKLLTCELTTRSTDYQPRTFDFHSDDVGLQLFVVYLEKEDVRLDSTSRSQGILADPGHHEQQAVALNALDSIFQREAHGTSALQVYGSKIFDMAGEPAMDGPVIELRRGVNAETCTLDLSVVRRVTPFMGFFIKPIQLGKLLELLISSKEGTGPSLTTDQLNGFLKGLNVKKTYGKKGVVEIIGLAHGNADQETLYWNDHTTTTVSKYMEKVHHHKREKEESPQQRCVVAGSPRCNQILLPALCDVIPGQYFPLPASSSYFQEDRKKTYHNLLREGSNTCLVLADGLFTKLLRCSVSSTIAGRFGLKVAGFEQYSTYERGAIEDCDRTVTGEILTTQEMKRKQVLTFDRPLIVLVFASVESKNFTNIVNKILRTYQGISSQIVFQHTRAYQEGAPSRMVLAAQEKLGQSNGDQSTPAIAGFFRKPAGLGKPGSAEEEKLQLETLCEAYKDVKLYCHANGYHFAGTFVRSTSSPKEEERKMEALMTRLKSGTQSATLDVSSLVSPSGRTKIIMLGIHVSKVQISHLKHSGKVEIPELDSHKQGAECVYLISIAAKRPGFGSRHIVRTFLQEGFPPKQEFAGGMAMEHVQAVIQELVEPASLKDSTLIVFRAGFPPGKILEGESGKLNDGVLLKGRADQEGLGNEDATDGELEGTVAKDDGEHLNSYDTAKKESCNEIWTVKAVGDDKDEKSSSHDTAKWEGVNGGDSDKGGSPTSARFCPKFAGKANGEVETLGRYARSGDARLLYLTVAAKTKARLFDPKGQTLCLEKVEVKQKQKQVNQTARMGSVSSILVRRPSAGSNPHIVDWLNQKRLSEGRGASTPVGLTGYASGDDIIDDSSVRDALLEACWDYTDGVWSSKNLACVSLAKKANRHAMRIIQVDGQGKPFLPEVHPDLKDCLHFI